MLRKSDRFSGRKNPIKDLAMDKLAKEKKLNFIYILINSIYWIVCCATGGYAYNYLSESRYADGTPVSDGTAGAIIAVIYLVTVVLQARLGSMIDKSEKITERDALTAIFASAAILAFAMSWIRSASLLLFAVMVICYSLMSTASPFINSLCFAYSGEGISINYGLGRGMGSAAYALASLLIGSLWARFGKAFVPYYVVISCIIGVVIIQMLPKYQKMRQGGKEKAKSLSYPEFFRRYGIMIPMLISMVMLFFGASMINVFMARVVANILGPEASAVSGAVASVQGRALALQAIVELPAMFFFYKLRLRFSVDRLLEISAAAFFTKFLLIRLAKSIGMFYFALCFQMAGYAVLQPAVVYFVQENIKEEDRNKGQALMGAAGIFASFLASLAGGQLLQRLGVSPVLTISVVVIGFGAALMIVSLLKHQKEHKQ